MSTPNQYAGITAAVITQGVARCMAWQVMPVIERRYLSIDEMLARAAAMAKEWRWGQHA